MGEFLSTIFSTCTEWGSRSTASVASSEEMKLIIVPIALDYSRSQNHWVPSLGRSLPSFSLSHLGHHLSSLFSIHRSFFSLHDRRRRFPCVPVQGIPFKGDNSIQTDRFDPTPTLGFPIVPIAESSEKSKIMFRRLPGALLSHYFQVKCSRGSEFFHRDCLG